MIRIAPEELARRAAGLAQRITQLPGMKVQIQEGESVVGGGSTPGQSMPTSLVCVSHPRLSAQALESELRKNEPPVIARIDRDQLVMDLRTVLENQEDKIVEALHLISGKFGDGH